MTGNNRPKGTHRIKFQERRPKKKDRQSSFQGMMEGLAQVSQLGFTLAAAVMIGVLIGSLLDRWINTSPIFVLIFSALGLFAALKYILDLSHDKKGRG